MAKKFLTTLLLLTVMVGSINAQRGKRAIQRIERDVQSQVFIPKGTWMAGGTVSYSEHDESNLNFLVIKDVEGKGYDFSVSPYVGYFFRDNIAAGFRFAYNRDYLDLGNLDMDLGDLTLSFKDLYYLEHKYEASGFLRTYMPIGRSKIFGLFNEARLTYKQDLWSFQRGPLDLWLWPWQELHRLGRYLRRFFPDRPEPANRFRSGIGCLHYRLVGCRGIGWRDGIQFQMDRSGNQSDRGGHATCLIRKFQDQPVFD